MLLEIILKCFSLRMIFDLLNQVMNVNALRSFHHRIWHTGDVEIDVSVIHRKVELVRVITIFEITNLLRELPSTGFPVRSGSFMTRLSSSFTGFTVRSEELSSPCDLQTISWVTGFPVRSSVGLGNWVGLEDSARGATLIFACGEYYWFVGFSW